MPREQSDVDEQRTLRNVRARLTMTAPVQAQPPGDTARAAARAAPRVALLLAAVIWGSAFVATKVCLQHMRPLDLMALRFAIGVPVLLAVVIIQRIPLTPVLRSRGWIVGGMVLAAHFFIQITGIQYTTATNTGWLIATTPLAMTLLAWAVLREPIRPAFLAGIGVASAGIVLLVSRGRLSDLSWMASPGDWLVLASAHTWALYSIATRRLAGMYHPLAVTVAVLLPVALASVAAFVLSGKANLVLQLPLTVALALLFLSIFATAIAHWFWQVGIGRLGAAQGGLFLFIEPLATTAVAVPLLHEPFGLAGASGAALVIAGVWWAQRGQAARVRD